MPNSYDFSVDDVVEEVARRILSGGRGKPPRGSESTQCSIGNCTSAPGPYVDYMGSDGEMVRAKFCQDHYDLWYRYMHKFKNEAAKPSSVSD